MSRLPSLFILGTALLGLVGLAALILGSSKQGGSSIFRKSDENAVDVQGDVPLARPRTEQDYLYELELLNVTDKPKALALAEAGERWFAPTGEAAEQRRAMRVTLLHELGRVSEAKSRAREFLDDFPNSRHLPSVRTIAQANEEPKAHEEAVEEQPVE